MSKMVNRRSSADLAAFAEDFHKAAQAQLARQLRTTPAERLRDLEAMWEFNEMVWARNPHVLRIAERLWEKQRR